MRGRVQGGLGGQRLSSWKGLLPMCQVCLRTLAKLPSPWFGAVPQVSKGREWLEATQSSSVTHPLKASPREAPPDHGGQWLRGRK